MKITVSAKGTSVDSEVDPRFGRTIGFVLFDTETGNSTWTIQPIVISPRVLESRPPK